LRELEALAVVRDRRSNTEALALVIGVDPRTPPLLRSFVLTEPEKVDAALLAEKVLKTLRKSDGLDRVRMAALARAVATLAADQDMEAACPSFQGRRSANAGSSGECPIAHLQGAGWSHPVKASELIIGLQMRYSR